MASFERFLEKYVALHQSGEPFVCVTLAGALGSTPQDAGSKMLVTKDGLRHGTVGGGRVEQKAIAFAQEQLRDAPSMATTTLVEWNLQRDVGMTCGGVVTLLFEMVRADAWCIAVFGAGHVANALVHVLMELDCQVVCIDPRRDWLDRLPISTRLTVVHESSMPDYVPQLRRDAFVLCLTMGHRTDRPVLEAILRQDFDYPFLGVIGSRAKRAVLTRELVDAGISKDRAEAFRCPVGLDFGTNDPKEIAISIAAQLLQVRDAMRASVE